LVTQELTVCGEIGVQLEIEVYLECGGVYYGEIMAEGFLTEEE